MMLYFCQVFKVVPLKSIPQELEYKCIIIHTIYFVCLVSVEFVGFHLTRLNANKLEPRALHASIIVTQ